MIAECGLGRGAREIVEAVYIAATCPASRGFRRGGRAAQARRAGKPLPQNSFQFTIYRLLLTVYRLLLTVYQKQLQQTEFQQKFRYSDVV